MSKNMMIKIMKEKKTRKKWQ